MEIKLHAKLKVYSKASNNNLPTPNIDNAGEFLGVGHDGNYVLFKKNLTGDSEAAH